MAKSCLYFLSLVVILLSCEMVSSIKISSLSNIEKRYKRKTDDDLSTGRLRAKDIKAGDISAGSVRADTIKADSIKATNIRATFLSVRRKYTDTDSKQSHNPAPPNPSEKTETKQRTKRPTTKSPETTKNKQRKPLSKQSATTKPLERTKNKPRKSPSKQSSTTKSTETTTNEQRKHPSKQSSTTNSSETTTNKHRKHPSKQSSTTKSSDTTTNKQGKLLTKPSSGLAKTTNTKPSTTNSAKSSGSSKTTGTKHSPPKDDDKVSGSAKTNTDPSLPNDSDKSGLPTPTVPPGKTINDGLLEAKSITSNHIDTDNMKARQIEANAIKASVVETDSVNIKAELESKMSSNDGSKINTPKPSEGIRKRTRINNKKLSKKGQSGTKKTVGNTKNKSLKPKPVAGQPTQKKSVKKDRQQLPTIPQHSDLNINPVLTIDRNNLKKIYLPDMLDDKDDIGKHEGIPNLQFFGLSPDYVKSLQEEKQTTGREHPSTKRTRTELNPNKFVNAHSPKTKPLVHT